MKRVEPMRLDAIINYMIDHTGLRPELQRRSIEQLWPEVAGKQIDRFTREVAVRDRTLYVRIVSAPLKEELSYLCPLLVRQLNEAAGADVISSIRLL